MGQEATVRTGHGKTGSKLRKEYNKAVYCHSACLTYMQCTTCEMQSEARIKIVGRSINNLRHVNDGTLTAESKETLKNLLMRMKEKSERTGLKLNIKRKKLRSWHPVPSLHIKP